jgi:outer membrane protein OmpA-like peptidoglycan-associated protein
LKENPNLHVALQGFTDNVGNPADNLILSENRAKTVYDYLISHEINKNRISYKGFGESRPVTTNATEQGRAKNRRTVFVVTSN